VVRVNDRGPYVGNRLIDVSVRTAKLLGFYDEGLTKVKVEYVGRAPLAGSSDGELLATLRKHAPVSGVQLASAGSFPSAYFNAKPMARVLPRRAPVPPDRPYGAEETAAALPSQGTLPVPSADAEASNQAVPQVSMVSAFAPERYDGHASFLSGRGLY
jgi:peptidoglycan lytic transglycosylase